MNGSLVFLSFLETKEKHKLVSIIHHIILNEYIF